MRYLVISDIHGNFHAFESVLRDAGAFDKVIFLGDIVDYGAQPNECIDRMKRLKAICLIGNHDLVQTGALPVRHMHSEARECSYWTQTHLTKRNRDWLGLHTSSRIRDEYYLVHGSPIDTALDYIDSTDKANKIFAQYKFPVLFHGHSHVPILFAEDEGYCFGTELENAYVNTNDKRCIINPGSVGQPRDGDERASYGIWEDGIFTWKRVEYDIRGAQKAIQEAGIPEGQSVRLMYGN